MNFDLSRYPWTKDEKGWHMDDVHVEAIFELIKAAQPASILEVGSWLGRSACAYVEAQRWGWGGEVHLCDVKITDAVRRLVEAAPYPDHFVFHECKSHEVWFPVDLCVIDGDHTIGGAMIDLAYALAFQVSWIVLHDWNAWPALPDCQGAWMAGRVMRQSTVYQSVWDAEPREEARTWRGLMISGPVKLKGLFDMEEPS